jgi:hypothetical protein
MEDVQDPVWMLESSEAITQDTVSKQYTKSQALDIETSDIFRVQTNDISGHFLLSSSYLNVEFEVQKNSGAPLTEADNHALASNGWLLFRQLDVSVENQRLFSVPQPGQVAHVNSLVNKSKEYFENNGPLSHMYLDRGDGFTGTSTFPTNYREIGSDTSAVADADLFVPRGLGVSNQMELTKEASSNLRAVRENPGYDKNFVAKVKRNSGKQWVQLRLADVSKFFDLDKVIVGSSIEFTITKNQTAPAVHGALDDSVLKITRCELWIEKLRANEKVASQFKKMIAEGKLVNHYFENSNLIKLAGENSLGAHQISVTSKVNKPNSVVIGFKRRARETSQQLNPLLFDLTDKVSRFQLLVNGTYYPLQAYAPNSNPGQIVNDLWALGNKEDSDDTPAISYDNWKESYGLYGFDLTTIESNSFDSRQSVVLDVLYNLDETVEPFDIYCFINSEMIASFNYSSGATQITIK